MEIRVENINKVFGEAHVLRDLSFTARPGEVLGLLGPNGAGKTTTLRLVLDILKPDEGSILFDGKPMNRNIRSAIGYLPEERGLYQKATVYDTLLYFGRLKNMSRKKAQVEAVRLLDRFGMVERMEDSAASLSKGMQQKIQLMLAIIHQPSVLILDEPFFGLDPLNQDLVRKLIAQARQEKKTVLLSTHQLNEAENLCDHIVLINYGKTVLQGSLSAIRERYRENLILVEAEGNLQVLKKLEGVRKFIQERNTARLYIDERVEPQAIAEQILKMVTITRLEINRPSLNDIFLEIIQETREAGS